MSATPPAAPAAPAAVPPPPPTAWEEALGYRLYLLLSPSIKTQSPQTPPDSLAPFEILSVPRPRGRGPLAATWFPAAGTARGAVLLLPPWLPWGRSYFHRRGRIGALRAAGYHALALDYGGFGGSRREGRLDEDVEAALDFLAGRNPGLPLHVWGVSAGGNWCHLVLSRREGVSGAMFEDVSPHLFEWTWRQAPASRPGLIFFRTFLRRAYRFFDLRRHAPMLKVAAAAYVSGALDPGVLPDETRELARLAGAECLIVPSAKHLASIKIAEGEVIGLALATFRKAEERGARKADGSP
jgi:pimeloyl-ACP methyl ester carboxylesterase